MEENIWFKTLEKLKKMPLREEEPVKKETTQETTKPSARKEEGVKMLRP